MRRGSGISLKNSFMADVTVCTSNRVKSTSSVQLLILFAHSSRSLISLTPLARWPLTGPSHSPVSLASLTRSSHSLLSLAPLTRSSHSLLSLAPLTRSSHSLLSLFSVTMFPLFMIGIPSFSNLSRSSSRFAFEQDMRKTPSTFTSVDIR